MYVCMYYCIKGSGGGGPLAPLDPPLQMYLCALHQFYPRDLYAIVWPAIRFNLSCMINAEQR